MRKRALDAQTLTPNVEEAFVCEDALPVHLRDLARAVEMPEVGMVVLYEGSPSTASPFRSADGDCMAMRVETIDRERLIGRRVVHAQSTFLMGCGHDAFFETDERAECTRPVLGALHCAPIEFKFVGMNRVERLGAAPAPSTNEWRGLILPAGTWPDELQTAVKRSQARTAGREQWTTRLQDPSRYPYASRRNPDAKVNGEHDGTPCGCLALQIAPGRARRLMRLVHLDGSWDGEVEWTDETVEYTKVVGRFEPGLDIFWTNGPEPCPQRAYEGNRPALRTLDVFAGCGGLMQGLSQSGLCRDGWAVETCAAACKSYKANFPNGEVYNEDCNTLLKRIMKGDADVPKRGEVEAVVGGPPCQGFSHMNRHKESEKYQTKNSLVASFLSFCDWYRPRLFMLENVPNFAMMDEGLALQLTARVLLKLKYQFTFEVLQAGQFGAPQSRYRFVLVAVPYDADLPSFPQPTHTMTGPRSALWVGKTKVEFGKGASWALPHVTVREAIGDLSTMDGEYSTQPQCAYQRWMREGSAAKPTWNEKREMTKMQQLRIERVPVGCLGADWRDLPDDADVELGDGRKTQKIKRGENGDATDEKQELTIIPWCLAHTALKHANWSGSYGRVQWDGYFPTTLTRVEAAQKQGTALHPDLPRLLTTRECARSQGFPDTYIFEGGRVKAQSQIGNAVPIPLSLALGRWYARSFVGAAVAAGERGAERARGDEREGA